MSAYGTSPETNEIDAALAKAQAEIENVEKAGANPAFKRGNDPSRYATLGSALEEVRPKLAKQGIAVIQMPINGEGSNIGVVTRLAHSSGQWIESTIYVPPQRFDAQGAGSVITYLRRYALMAMAGIAPEDDDGNAAVAAPVQQPRNYGNGKPNGATLPSNPEEPPEIAEDRKRIRALIDRLAERIKTAPDEHRLEVIMDDARAGDLKEIEESGPKGHEAANVLRARYNAKVAELRSGKAA